MIHPPSYPDYVTPGTPRWRRWWLALLVLWGGQSALLMFLWPEHRARLELWLWSAVLPLLWGLTLALRSLIWQIGLGNREAYRGVIEAALQRWWRKRSQGLPVEQVLLFGPAGERQSTYAQQMKGNVPLPQPQKPSAGAADVLRCPLSSTLSSGRGPLVGQHLARMLLTQAQLAERWPSLRAVAWCGSTESYRSFAKTLQVEGVQVPESALSLADLPALDRLIDNFLKRCPEDEDWLLCAGVISVDRSQSDLMASEAAFAWLVSHRPASYLKRGEYLLADKGEMPAELCAQIQRYAGLEASPEASLAMDAASMEAFVEGGWPTSEHLLQAHWGELEGLAPFIGMSLALLHSASSSQPCGWMSRDGEQRLAIGMAVANGKG
ncbi:hypothetical protein NJF44_25290 [Pseudomonas guariconensis]|uniref:hypothetical protein n=1 Tax=Pseudomonas TaxID=286 RepID=UPI00209764CA|nr:MULTISPECIES: hypothetical protein [Pseudomonas]MCO7643763.1 hypothetical protein [Pseudomonas sp. S 311-6]MCO7518046.1 hypothetical protein [Pseudomonas putida]MCO7568297.1 hypothetical protein [Pseudomonas mosselii]MCO7608546.1 hypothetical protein [Pseudomonas guariconensis]MCO7619980.1 hypothetical protein [Pseudomonas guariconensis]